MQLTIYFKWQATMLTKQTFHEFAYIIVTTILILIKINTAMYDWCKAAFHKKNSTINVLWMQNNNTQKFYGLFNIKRIIHFTIHQSWSVNKCDQAELLLLGSRNFCCDIVNKTWKTNKGYREHINKDLEKYCSLYT